MKTLYEVAENPSGLDSFDNYMGETPPRDWLVVLGRNRDSDVLSESNWESALLLLCGESESVRVFRFGHWACGWIEYLCVAASSPEHVQIGEDIVAQIADYPVLDEDDYSTREQEAAYSIWSECFDVQERVQYIRDHKSDFEFHGFCDLLACVRGKYFAGYASTLLC